MLARPILFVFTIALVPNFLVAWLWKDDEKRILADFMCK